MTAVHQNDSAGYDGVATRRQPAVVDPVQPPPQLAPVGVLRGTGQSETALRIKDLADRLISLAAVVVAMPVMAAVAVAIRLTSPGPVLFRQERVGRGGRIFRIYKFRTMRPDAEQILQSDPELQARYRAGGFKLSLDGDPRITRLGVILRRYSIDEIPQLWNVLAGDMSLVGPRPVLRHELLEYGSLASTYTSVRPGITGPWQISGRDDITTHADRAKLIEHYIDNWSLLVDAKILIRTIPAALGAKGVG